MIAFSEGFGEMSPGVGGYTLATLARELPNWVATPA